MALEEVTRDDHFQGWEKPFVSIQPDHVYFNARFVRLANLKPRLMVKFFVDQQSRRMGMKFHNDVEEQNSYRLTGGARKSFFCTAIGINREYPLIKNISNLTDRKQRRLEPTEESTEKGKLWMVDLVPCFEIKKARESAGIPSDVSGIYRYVRGGTGEVVYIGRGTIAERLRSPERENWDFDVIEYSIIPDPDQQVHWEDYWIGRHEEKFGKRPFYNKISGQEAKHSPKDLVLSKR